MNKTGNKSWDELPPMMGAKNVDELRLKLIQHENAILDITKKLNLCVDNYKLLKDMKTK